jgi:hypothetical protein
MLRPAHSVALIWRCDASPAHPAGTHLEIEPPMNARALAVLILLTIPLAGCVIAGGVNYHFPNKPSPTGEKKCDPADKSADCARPSDRKRP